MAIAGNKITSYHVVSQGGEKIAEDIAIITLAFEDGSCGVIHYLANGE